MKRIFCCFLVLIIGLNCTFLATANSTTALVLEYKEGSVKKGETVKVSFIINNNTGFGTISATIGFNNSNLELKSVKKTYTPTSNYTDEFLLPSVENANRLGKVRVGYTPKVLAPNTYTSPITYNGVLAELTFVALKDCVVEAYFVQHELYLDDFDMTDVKHVTLIKKLPSGENTSSAVSGNQSQISSILAATGSNVTGQNTSQIENNSSKIDTVTSGENEVETNTSNPVSNQGNGEENQPVDYDYLPIIIFVLIGGLIIVAVAFVIKKIKK